MIVLGNIDNEIFPLIMTRNPSFGLFDSLSLVLLQISFIDAMLLCVRKLRIYVEQRKPNKHVAMHLY